MIGLLLVPVAFLAGSLWGAPLVGEVSRGFRWLLFGVAGWLMLVLTGALASGLRLGLVWPAAFMGCLAVAGLVTTIRRGRLVSERGVSAETPRTPAWGLGLALVPITVFATLAGRGTVVGPAFLFDVATPVRQLVEGLHPEPAGSLAVFGLAAVARLDVVWHPGTLLIWSSLCFVGLALASRETVRATPGPGAELTVLAMVLGVGAAAMQGRLAGSDDWWIALALLGACPALLGREQSAARDVQVGMMAALAGTAGLNGLAVGALLIVARATSVGPGSRSGSTRWVALVGPLLVIALTWGLLRGDALLANVSLLAGLDVGRLPTWLASTMAHPDVAAWRGLALLLLTAPWLVLHPWTRPVGMIVSGQLVLTVVLGLAVASDVGSTVAVTVPSALLQILPLVITVCGAGLVRFLAGLSPQSTSGRGAATADSKMPTFDSARSIHPFDDEWRALLASWHLVRLWTLRKILLRYKRSVLGVLWTLIEPLALIAILTIVFSTVFRFDVPNYAVYILAGWLAWDFFSKATLGIVSEVSDGLRLTARVHAPRSAFVVAALLAQLFNWCVALLPMTLALLILRHPLAPAAWGLPVGMALLAIFTLGVGLIAATINVFFRDFAHLFQVLLTIWLYATPIIYPLDIVPERARALFLLNPLSHLVALVRDPIYAGVSPPATVWMTGALLSVGTFAVGWWVFTRHRDAFIFHA